MTKIDKNIPIPRPRGGGNYKSKYPWRYMEIGDSFFIETKSQKSAAAYARVVGPRIGAKFATRSVPGGIRVWRIE